MPEKRVFQMFQKQEMYCRNVLCWKDKYENFLLKTDFMLDERHVTYAFKNSFFAQCWTREAFSEAMWGIYANVPGEKYLRVRSTPRKLLTSITKAHEKDHKLSCYIGLVKYRKHKFFEDYVKNFGIFQVNIERIISSILIKRFAFKHEKEVRLVYWRQDSDEFQDSYSYKFDPHLAFTQIMADPQRDPKIWKQERNRILRATGFKKRILRSMMYDAPKWKTPQFR